MKIVIINLNNQFYMYICRFKSIKQIMKKIILISVLALFGMSLSAQNCVAFVPEEIGTSLKYSNANAKGKIDSYNMRTVLDIQNEDGTITYTILSQSFDSKNKEEETYRDTMIFMCKDGNFVVDMEQYLDPTQMEEQEENEDISINISFDEITIPSDLSVGKKLADGSVTVEFVGGPIVITNTTNITNREVTAHEEISTPAGKFKCYKVEQDISNKMGFITVQVHSIDWIKEGTGTIRSESYNKKGNLQTVTELVEIIK